MFQSTPPRGGRPRLSGRETPHEGFNPRPRAGGDLRICIIYQCSYWFQSTPPRGGRPRRTVLQYCKIQVSIHAPARGATPAHGAMVPV